MSNKKEKVLLQDDRDRNKAKINKIKKKRGENFRQNSSMLYQTQLVILPCLCL
jgi:hypothetical protein